MIQNLPDITKLDDLSGVHYGDLIGNACDNTEIVSNEDHAYIEVVAKLIKQLKYLGLHRHIERCCRLVGDEEFWSTGKRYCDHDPLTHATRQLVRVSIHTPRRMRNPNKTDEFESPLARLFARYPLMNPYCFDYLFTASIYGVQRHSGILKNHCNILAADFRHVRLFKLQEVLPLEKNLTRNNLAG